MTTAIEEISTRSDAPERSARASATSDDSLHEQLERVWRRRPGVLGRLASTNHKDVGLRFIVTAFVFFALAGVLALVMRLQLAKPGNTLVNPDLYNQLFTTHGSAMMFLFAVPVMEGMGLYLVPLMVGARNVAFPRLMAYAYWTFLASGILLFGGLAMNIGPDMGWFGYVPLSGPEYSPGKRVDLWSQMITLVEIASMALAVDIIVTILKLRAPGMSLGRMPLFVWTQLVTGFMVIFAMPAVALGSTLLTLDRLTNVGTHFFNVAEGGDAILWQHLFWFFGHPDVYIIFIPATGFISSIVAAFCRRPVFGYTPLVLSIIAIGFIGFGVWVHHMFVTPIPDLGQGMFTAASMMIVIPSGVQIFCWTATFWLARRVHVRTPLLFVLGFFATFVIGGLTGVMLASVSIDTQVHDTFFVVAHLHYVLIGGAIFPLIGAIYFWFPKFTGRMASEGWGRVSFWLLFAGFHMTFYPQHHLGFHGMPRRIYTYGAETGWGYLNLLSTVGAFTLGLGVLTFATNLLVSLKRGPRAGPNPWGAGTLEWAAASPPASYNFAYPPTCHGREPVWENPPDAPVITGLSTDKRELLCTTLMDAAPDHRYAVAGNSLWPLALAIPTATALITGGMFHPAGAVYSAVGVAVALCGWFWASGGRKGQEGGGPLTKD
ncbi:MAG TPA: cytochrome c oxidase subunit I [Tepidisphaeraceae bacterium]|nr:cytochrome c oxidase subunit I [Tepidisphaeraceae bacterium]